MWDQGATCPSCLPAQDLGNGSDCKVALRTRLSLWGRDRGPGRKNGTVPVCNLRAWQRHKLGQGAGQAAVRLARGRLLQEMLLDSCEGKQCPQVMSTHSRDGDLSQKEVSGQTWLCVVRCPLC